MSPASSRVGPAADPVGERASRIGFVLPRPTHPSGGHHYNQAVLRHWPAGVPVPEVVELDGPWPEGDDAVRRALADALTRFDLVILDGLVAAARPELIETAQGRVVLLVHLPLADAGGLDEVVAARLEDDEGRSVRAAWRVIATSATAAADIVRRHGRPDVHVVRPGVESAPLSSGPDPGPSSGGGDRVSSSTRLDPEPSSGGPDPEPSSGGPDRVSSSGGGDRAPLSKRSNRMPSSSQVGPVSSNSGLNPAVPSPPSGQEPVPHLISVGTLGDRKNQLAFAHALQACADLPWTASVIGPQVALDYAERVRSALPRQARLRGALTGSQLEDEWGRAALLVHPARAETWGMVVTEALAHGVPAIVGRGTGAEEALRSGGGMPGASVDPDDPDELAALLRRWLTDSALRADWRTQALAGRQRLRGWPQAAQEFADASGAGHDTVPGNGSGARNRAVAAVGPPREPRSRPGDSPPAPIAADWLALRRPADEAAREASQPLLQALRRALPPGPVTVVDLGAGTGANRAWLGPRLGRESRWVLVDHDPTLLAASDNSSGTRIVGGLAEASLALRQATGARFLTCSALLDLLTATELDRLAEVLADLQVPALCALSVDGSFGLVPPDAVDSLISEAFNAHQRRAGRPGPEAPTAFAAACETRGLQVRRAETPWELDGSRPDLLRRLLTERAAAAADQRPDEADRIAGWLARRLDHLQQGTLTVRVGHLDLLVLPGR